MLRTLAIAGMIVLRSSAESTECAVEDVHYYDKTESGGDPAEVYTLRCADFMIRNRAEGSRFDPTLRVLFVGGTTESVKLQTPRIDTGGTHAIDRCFGKIRVRQLTCTW